MPDVLESTIPPTAGVEVQPLTYLEEGECFVPHIPLVPVRSPPKRVPRPKRSAFARAFDKFYRNRGWDAPTATDISREKAISASVAGGIAGDTHP
jgi:hypothetical protein